MGNALIERRDRYETQLPERDQGNHEQNSRDPLACFAQHTDAGACSTLPKQFEQQQHKIQFADATPESTAPERIEVRIERKYLLAVSKPASGRRISAQGGWKH